MIPCVCINSKNKPNEVLLQNWIQEGFNYHITHIFHQINEEQKGMLSVLLQEVSTKSEKYNCYRLDRFGFKEEDLIKLKELMTNCFELNGFDINELIKESELQIVEK